MTWEKAVSELLYTVEEIQTIIEPIAKKHQIPAVYLFGSYARGTATESSDIDLLIDTAGTALTSLFSLGALYCELEEALQKNIDLITVSSLQQKTQMPSDCDFRKAILDERLPIYHAV